MARHATASQLERIVRNYRIARSLDRDGEPREQERSLDCWWDEHGCLSIRGRLAPEQGAVFLKALQRAVDELAEVPGLSRLLAERLHEQLGR